MRISGGFSHALEKVDMTVPYFIPPWRMVEAMKKARARGVEVEVLVPGKSDVGLADWLREGLYPDLIKKGIRFYEYQHSILHAKSMVVDGWVVIIGSANFDFLSISMNWEQALVIDDVGIVREVNE
jgi:cardiolipin synthase